MSGIIRHLVNVLSGLTDRKAASPSKEPANSPAPAVQHIEPGIPAIRGELALPMRTASLGPVTVERAAFTNGGFRIPVPQPVDGRLNPHEFAQRGIKRAQSVSNLTIPEILRRVSVKLGHQYRDDNEPYRGGAPAKADEARWHGPGEMISVKGIVLPGMVYVGKFLAADPTGRTPRIPAPCLIRPSLPVSLAPSGKQTTHRFYEPSYSEFEPHFRMAYLMWLADGMPPQANDLGFVTLYFQGLERRLLVDRPPAAERDLLVAEVQRLIRIHPERFAYGSHGQGLLEMVEAMARLSDPEAMALWSPEPSVVARPMNFSTKLVLAARIVRGETLDAELAIAGYLAYADSTFRISRIGASRTRPEFIALMRARFPSAFPRGLRIADRKTAGGFNAGYGLSSQHLSIRFELARGLARLPDPNDLTWTQMDTFADRAIEDLTPYARAVGPEGKGAGTVGALRLLPPELAGHDPHGSRAALSSWLETLPQNNPTPFGELAGRAMGLADAAFSAKQVSLVAEALAPMGWGLEPDPAFSRIPSKVKEVVYLFRRHEGPVSREPSPALERGMLAALVTAATNGVARKAGGNRSDDEDGPVVDGWIAALAPALGLNEHEQRRLHVHQTWLVRERSPGTAEAKRRCAALTQAERVEMAALLTRAYGAADGMGASLMALEAIHDALGVPRSDLYASVHEADAEASRARREQTTGATGAGQPVRPAGNPPAAPGTLDLDRIRLIREETHQVSSALSEIYREDEDPEPPQAPSKSDAPNVAAPSADPRFEGLDPELVPLAVLLATREEWSRDAYEAAATNFGLMPNGALETINEWAFDALGDALAEDGDQITINTTLLPPAR